MSAPPESGTNAEIRAHATRAGLVLGLVVAVGVAGFHLIEGWSFLDALYMTVTTIATVGFGEIHPLSPEGRTFTLGIILVGVGNLAYAFAGTTHFFAAGGVAAYRRRSKMERTLDKATDHTIVCGCGRLGSAVVAELLAQGVPVVVIERDEAVLRRLEAAGNVPFVNGDAELDDVLVAAGIKRARSLVAALNDDASNVFLTLTARVLNPALVIYGKADNPATLQKLQRAGADHSFSPSHVAGHRIAQQIVRPAVTELVGIAVGNTNVELVIEEVLVDRLGLAEGATLASCLLSGHPDILVLAIKARDGAVVFPARPDAPLSPGDRVIVMGPSARLTSILSGA